MDFSELLRAVRQTPDALRIPADWGQGRASFGGLVAALVYACMRRQVPAERAPRSLAITFVGPVAADVPTRFEAELLREGKAVSQVLGRALQNGEVVALVQGSFGAPRPSSVSVAAAPAPTIKAVTDCQELPYIPQVTPEFTRHLAMRWGLGSMPFTGSSAREMGGWVRFRDQHKPEPIDEAHLLALVDAWPPALLSHLKSPAPGSSLTWTIEFIQPLLALTTAHWCLYRAEIEHARDGYGHVAAALWADSGELLAISRQTVTVFG
ncbi:acyl-CoA thioesterase [Phytopseudomonas dryadis]|uniref:Acyl-CoA thioesterase II n=1 Tax=Phytopseudomonas dryadis TaxID=2487520 RepID=A0A4Q9RBQ6_9GAMM|nr:MULTISPECIES: thioesterase family protein [Pseudomonas]TBU97668.1 acyl-CoA thioesterase II [Pseudomonas dryadis]TBV10122.1 acyl-CoA thioesterase II [Pseudomonas dryadis]TBV19046.1 acyl-CoA thioesterase II [Pseudomonas sp. FRB 230]